MDKFCRWVREYLNHIKLKIIDGLGQIYNFDWFKFNKVNELKKKKMGYRPHISF